MPTRPAIVGWRRQAGLVMFMSFPSGLGTEGEHANRCRDLLLEGAAGRSWEPARPQGTAVSCGSDLLGSGLRSVGPREATGGPGGRSFGGERSSGVTGGRHELWTHARRWHGSTPYRPSRCRAATSKREPARAAYCWRRASQARRWADGTWPGKGSAILSI